VMPGADDALLGVVSIKVYRAITWPGDDTGGSLQDLLMRGSDIGVPGFTAPGNVTPALGFLGAMGLGYLDCSY
jgi:hypothetical protein